MIWATARKKIYVPADQATVFIGSSRIKFDLDTPTWKSLSGDTHHDGTPSSSRHGISTWVLLNENNQWLLLAVQNVNIETPK